MAPMARACLDAADLPGAVQAFVAERAEGIPFLVEEVLAGLIGEGALTERDGSWQASNLVAAGVPATFGDAVRRRLDAVDADSRRVIGAAAVLGRRFDWALLSPVTGMAAADVVAALRRGVGLQLIAADRESFRFRHALTHEAVLAGLLPPERALLAGRALAAVEAAHPGLPGAWCTLAAELAGRADNPAQAGALLLEAGRRDLALGALASAEHTLTRARALIGPDDACGTSVDEALTEVFAMSGQVDQAIEMGKMLLARLGGARRSAGGKPAPGDRAGGDRRSAVGGGRGQHRGRPPVPRGRYRPDRRLRGAGRGRPGPAWPRRTSWPGPRCAAAEDGGLPEVACEALEVIGRVARQRDLEAAERRIRPGGGRRRRARPAAVAAAGAARTRHHRPARTESVDRLQQARELAVAQGALALTATLDLQIAAGLNKQFRAGEALRAARRSADASRRFHLATLPMALIFQATAHAIRGEEQDMEARIAEAIALAPADQDVLGCAWGHCRATFSLLADDLGEAHARMATGAGAAAEFPGHDRAAVPRALAAAGRAARPGRGEAAARVRAAHGTRHLVVAALLGYADAILAGRRGRAVTPRRRSPPRTGRWARWWPGTGSTRAGSPPRRPWPTAGVSRSAWLREAAAYFAARGDDRVAAACRGLLRRAGAPVPRRPGGRRRTAGPAACAGRDRTRGRCPQAGRAGPGQPGDRGADVPVAAHRREARGEPARQDRPAPGPASWVFRRARWVAAAGS